MIKKIMCATRYGISAKIVQVESSIMRAIPEFNIIGLAQNSIQEAKSRIKSAFEHSSISMPNARQININLSPADISKTGSHFDLAIALLIAMQDSAVDFSKWFAFGELGLDGSIKDTISIYPLLLKVSLEHPNSCVLLPSSGSDIYSSIPNLNIYYASTLKEACSVMENPVDKVESSELSFDSVELSGKKYYFEQNFPLDFADIKGQERAVEAALIAASGMHNLLLEGSPGTGKSLIAERLHYIMPPMSLEEMMDCLKIQTLADISTSYSPLRPLRKPEPSSSQPAILGSVSGFIAKPGEIALANHGILFLDELPNFASKTREALRAPIESNEINISRTNLKVTYKSKFLLLCAMNPCPCGYLNSFVKECTCSEMAIRKYQSFSGPFIDRIDMRVKMKEDRSEDLKQGLEKKPGEPSKTLFEKVMRAFRIRILRNQSEFNAKLAPKDLEKFCPLDDDALSTLNSLVYRFKLSNRGRDKIRRLGRTIADLEGEDHISKSHLLKAANFYGR